MKLCERCADAVEEASGSSVNVHLNPGESEAVAFGHPSGHTFTIIPASVCEFWAHRRLNEIKQDLAVEGMLVKETERGIFISRVRLPHD